MLESGLRRAWRAVVNARTLVMIALLAIVGGALPVSPAAAAGNGVLTVNVTILDPNGVEVTTIDPKVVGTYSVNVAYSCSVAACDSTTVQLAPTPLDPYYNAYRKESAFTVTPPVGTAITTTGNLVSGITVNLGNVAVGTSTSLKVNYRVNGTSSTVSGNNFFPTGSLIQPQVTVSSSTAVAPVTDTATATWQTHVPDPFLQPSAPARTRTDTDITLTTGLSNSGCVARGGGVWGSIAGELCAQGYAVTMHLPDNAQYVSGGSFDPVSRNVTWSASGNTVNAAAGYGAASTPIVVNFPNTAYPTTSPGCIASETFDFTYTVTYLEGTVKTLTAPQAVEVQNCTPFAKGTISKVLFASGAQSPVTTVAVPTNPGDTKGVSWQVTAGNQANVAGVATIVDNTLDQDDMAITQIGIGVGGPATVTYTLDDNTTGTVSINTGGVYNAPGGRRITKVTAVSSELIGPNTLPTQGASTGFVVRFGGLLPWDATLGTRTNTATGSIDYPDYPALDPVPLQAVRTVNIVAASTNVGASAATLAAQLGSPAITPVAGTEVPWLVRGQYTNVAGGSLIRPQYVFAAPVGWNIVPGGAAMEATAPPGVTLTYRTVTIGGASRQAVVADWPGVVGQTGTVNLPSMTIRTVPTTVATPGTNNQTASFFVGDADNGDFATYSTGKYTDATDIDNDGLTTENFAQRNTSVSLAPTTAVGALKEICRPDPSAVDGCDWIADSSVKVGVPPTATSIKYRVTIQNLGNGSLSNIVGYDVLPYIGDTGTTTATASTPRGSTVKEQLASVSNVAAGVTLTYSTSTNPPRPEVYSGATTGTFTSTLAGASAIRMAVASLPAGESRSFVYEAGLVGGSADQTACNSVAITATGLTAIEPAAVCATTQEADFSITDADRFPLQEGRAGVMPFVVNQGGGSQLASGTVTIEVPADVTLGDLTLTPNWRCEAPTTSGPVTVTCVPVKPDTTRRQLAINSPETISLEVIPAAGTAGSTLCFDAVVDGLINDPVASNDEVTSCSDVVAADTGVSVTKDDGTTIVAPGAQTTYTIVVANVLSAETVTGAVLTDALPANATFVSANPAPTTSAGGTLTWNLADLAPAGVSGPDGDVGTGGPGSTQTITVTVAVPAGATGTVVNTATVTAADPAGGGDLTAIDGDTDTVQSASMTLAKTAAPAGVNVVGDVVTYTFVAKNTGNVPLGNVGIVDLHAGLSAIDCGGVTTLAAGAQVSCTATYAATAADFAAGQIVNTATVSGQPAVGPAAVSPEATATVAAEAAPRLDLTKTATEANFDAAGDVIHFTFDVSNSGNVALSGLSVADQLPGTAPVSCVATSLAPGASTTCSTTYTATQADVDAGQIVNKATATATAANGAPVTSTPAQATVEATQNPVMTLDKSATETSFDAAGTVLHYRFVVMNTGNVTLHGVEVVDPLVSDLSCPSPTLPPGQSMTCTATYTTTTADVNAGQVDNTATASSTEAPDVTDNYTVLADAQPAIAIVKSVADTQLLNAGQDLDYTFVVTNTGNQTLTGVSVIDDSFGGAVVLDGCGVTTLNPGESTTCTGHYTLSQDDIDDADQLTNSATAVGTPPVGPAVTSLPDSASVPPVVAPQLTVDKTSETLSFDAVDTTITFDFDVTNSGNVTIDQLQINDPLPGVGTATCEDADGVLAPGASTVCHATYTTTQADLDNGGVTNTATASGTSPSGAAVVSNIDTLEIDATQSPTAALEKGGAADVGDVDTVGEQVTFTFDVHNTGNVTLTGLGVTDDLAGVSAVSCPSNVLVADGEVRCTATYAVTQADLDAGEISNHASVSATQGDDLAEDDFDLDVAQNGAISLDKSTATSSFDGPGQVIAYEFLVTNTGNVGVTGLAVTDDLLGAGGVTCPVATLVPQASMTCTGSYTTTQADVDFGSVVNNATATATASGGAPVTAADDETVEAEQTPNIALTKTADAVDGQVDAAGTVITYTLTVENTGNVTLSGVTVTEQLPGTSATTDCNTAELAPGGQTTCDVTYTTTQQNVDDGGFTNTATVTATGPGDTTKTATATAPLIAVQTPGWTFTKSADDGGFDAAGDVLTFTLTVTNTGNVTFTGVAVTDALPGATVDCPSDTLAPQDDPLVCTATYTVTQQDVDNGVVFNDAHVSAMVPGDVEPWEQDASATVIGTQTASIALVKSAEEPSFAAAGQTLHYRFAVTNTGNVTLSDLTVTDPLPDLSAITCPVTALAPAETTTCTATYSTTQADLDAGQVMNTATATAVAPTPDEGPVTLALALVTVSAESSVTVPAVQAPGFTLVKSVEETSFTAGSTLHYRFLITNTGNTTIEQLAVADPMPGLSPVSCPVANLAPGESTTCTATYVATANDVANGRITNTATVVGVPVQGDQLVSEPSTVEVAAVVTPPPPPPSTTPTEPSVPGELPATGGDSNRLLTIAAALLLAGLLALTVVHRRRRRPA